MIKVFHNELMVRTRSYLLQDSCPNQPIIRTRFTFIAGFLSESAYHSDPFHIHCRIPSESAYHSDPFHIHCRIPVRISLSFGPVSHLLQEACLNQPPNRTRFTFIESSPLFCVKCFFMVIMFFSFI